MQVPFLYRTVHAKHHTKKVQRMTEALRLSVLEEIVNTGCSVAAVNIVGAHPLSRTLYNIVIVYLIIELHCGARLPFACRELSPDFEGHQSLPPSSTIVPFRAVVSAGPLRACYRCVAR